MADRFEIKVMRKVVQSDLVLTEIEIEMTKS